MKIVGIIFIVAGLLGLIYGGFSYTKDTTEAKIGPLELKVRQQETVSIPMVASGAALVVGIVLVVVGGKK
jgi:TRAP-type C4-dicarboxylate transport system permease small subunit